MSLITRMLKQKATYWAPAALNEFGQTAFASPVELSCRWEGKLGERITLDGDTKVSNAKVYVSADVVVGGYLWLGTVETAPSDPKLDKMAYEITSFDKTPNFKATEFLRIAGV